MENPEARTAARHDLSPDMQRIATASHHDPFSVLGKHTAGQEEIVRVFIPSAREVRITEPDMSLHPLDDTGFFEWVGQAGTVPERYQLTWRDRYDAMHTAYDPYCFPAQLADYDLYLFGEGKHWHAYRFLGAHVQTVDGVAGVRFATWAPAAERVSVVGDFNGWDGRHHTMRVRGGTGVWELFVPGVEPGTLYKFEIRNRETGKIYLKSDPYAQHFEKRPSTASVVAVPDTYEWDDQRWMEHRARAEWLHAPLSIYEVHLGSWRRDTDGNFLNYREIAHELVEYVLELGFTHIELLPVTEHPLDASWGYQTIGYYAATTRHGDPEDFRYFVDYCHRHGIGVFMDWAPGHFPKDPHGLARFDGSAVYEHEDPRRGEHRDWGTLIFNYGRHEVRNFLLSSAVYWLEELHIDGLRVDAVASMLYLDYSRGANDWVPNVHGGRENLDAITFLRQLNQVTHKLQPGTLIMAEESTDWPMVSRPTWLGGLGFSMKWNMGWMHDTLEYITKDPIHRHYHHNNLTFGLLYAFHENFILPFSHDEVVHGKASMLYKMPGDEWQKFANLRALYTFMFTHPGKKLLFMGCEFGQGPEWNHDTQLDWYVLQYPLHQGLKHLVSDLNRLSCGEPALHRYDFDQRGFEWIDCHDAAQSTLSYMRKSEDETLIVVLNFTPVVRENYRIGVPYAGGYQEIFNSDSVYYGGTNVGNSGYLQAEATRWMNLPYSLTLTLPPLGGIVLRPVGGEQP